MKTFNKQYCECHDEGFQGIGEILKFKDHPELLPALWSKAAKTIAKKLKEDPEFGLRPVICLRFGGECTSGKLECQLLRNQK